MKKTLRTAALASALAAGIAVSASASAGTLEFQGVTFTTSWTGNVLTLQVDAAHPTGDWAGATTIGALQLKDVGRFDSVSLSSAPGDAVNWALSSNELNANGCGGGAHPGMGACFSGTPVALTDNMVFKFTFNGGGTDFSAPDLKVNLFNGAGGGKVGSLLSMNIPAAPVPEPGQWAMLFGGLSVMGALARRRKKRLK